MFADYAHFPYTGQHRNVHIFIVLWLYSIHTKNGICAWTNERLSLDVQYEYRLHGLMNEARKYFVVFALHVYELPCCHIAINKYKTKKWARRSQYQLTYSPRIMELMQFVVLRCEHTQYIHRFIYEQITLGGWQIHTSPSPAHYMEIDFLESIMDIDARSRSHCGFVRMNQPISHRVGSKIR